jgi:hypothetical protein
LNFFNFFIFKFIIYFCAVIIELQRLFASLVLSTQKYVDPSHMLKKLKDKAGNTLKIGNQEDVVGMLKLRFHVSVSLYFIRVFIYLCLI